MQVEISLRMLKAGKHVIQDLKLIFTFLILILTLSLSFAWLTNLTNKEKPAAGSKYSGGFILDMGVHFVAGLRMDQFIIMLNRWLGVRSAVCLPLPVMWIWPCRHLTIYVLFCKFRSLVKFQEFLGLFLILNNVHL
ncbi:hypothetical protein GW17_00047332 [Ensete ventricosum]|nr:hypothetical protein GW17_00047332 [Ensete ventricosum]